MDQDLISDDMPRGRRRTMVAIVLVLLGCGVLYFVDFHISEALDQNRLAGSLKQNATIIRAVLENLIAGALAAVLLALSYRWIVALIDPRDRVIEIAPGAITDRLLKTRSGRETTFLSGIQLRLWLQRCCQY